MRVTARLRLIFSFGFLLMALPLSCAVMNYGGLCVVRAERMSDARMINIAITQLLDSMRPPDSLWVEQGGGLWRWICLRMRCRIPTFLNFFN